MSTECQENAIPIYQQVSVGRRPVKVFNKRLACLNDHCLIFLRHTANGKEQYRSIHRKMQSLDLLNSRTRSHGLSQL